MDTAMAAAGGDSGAIQLSSSTQLRYELLMSLAALLLLTALLVVSIFCLRRHYLLSIHNAAATVSGNVTLPDGDGGVGGGRGMDAAALERWCPEMSYRWGKVFRSPSQSERHACCAICLADYCERDSLRVVPQCGHVFHTHCVDKWLLAHATCPVCRGPPVPDHAPDAVGEPLAVVLGHPD